MPRSKRSRKKATKRLPKKQARKQRAIIRFTATQKGTVVQRQAADEVWLLIGPPSWMKYGSIRPGGDVERVSRMKQAAVKALQKFKQR